MEEDVLIEEMQDYFGFEVEEYRRLVNGCRRVIYAIKKNNGGKAPFGAMTLFSMMTHAGIPKKVLVNKGKTFVFFRQVPCNMYPDEEYLVLRYFKKKRGVWMELSMEDPFVKDALANGKAVYESKERNRKKK